MTPDETSRRSDPNDGGPIWLSLGGPPGTREFLGALFNPFNR